MLVNLSKIILTYVHLIINHCQYTTDHTAVIDLYHDVFFKIFSTYFDAIFSIIELT